MRRLFQRNLNTIDLPKIRRLKQQNKPINSPWRQQQLKSYRPLLTLKYGVLLVIIVEIVLIFAGAFLYNTANQAKEGIIDYTYCTEFNGTIHLPDMLKYQDDGSDKNFFSELKEEKDEADRSNKTCFYNIEMTSAYEGDVVFYYGLENYYQNMRLYVRSRNDDQLQGKHLDEVEDCQPYKTATNSLNQTIPIAPCGAVANSLFNDTFKLYYSLPNGSSIQVPWTTKDMIDPKLYKKYANPPHSNGSLCAAFANTTSPPAWQTPVCQLNDSDGGSGFENFDFIIWMQTASLPKFRKIYRGLDRSKDAIFRDGLPKGTYKLQITDNYPVRDYNGRKRFIIGIGGMYGQKSYFLPLAYFTVAMGIFFATTFLIVIQCCKCTYLEHRIERVVRRF